MTSPNLCPSGLRSCRRGIYLHPNHGPEYNPPNHGQESASAVTSAVPQANRQAAHVHDPRAARDGEGREREATPRFAVDRGSTTGAIPHGSHHDEAARNVCAPFAELQARDRGMVTLERAIPPQMTIPPDWRDRLRAAIVRTGLKQSAIAEAAGVAPGTLSRILTGRLGNPSFETVVRIAHVCNESVGWIFGERGFMLSSQQRDP